LGLTYPRGLNVPRRQEKAVTVLPGRNVEGDPARGGSSRSLALLDRPAMLEDLARQAQGVSVEHRRAGCAARSARGIESAQVDEVDIRVRRRGAAVVAKVRREGGLRAVPARVYARLAHVVGERAARTMMREPLYLVRRQEMEHHDLLLVGAPRAHAR